MSSKFVDVTAIMQVIGCIYNQPQLLDCTDKYVLTEEDFPDKFHQVVFGSIYKLHELGAKTISLENIADFLEARPKYKAVYEQKGDEWVLRVAENAILSTFDYYYNRLKKMTLLRAFDKYGIDVTDIYDPDNILDTKKKQIQEEQLDNSTLSEIAQKINNKIDEICLKYVSCSDGEAYQAGDNIFDLIENLKEHPEVGVPLYGTYINTVTRGARLKKFYLRSAATGTGKAIPDYTEIPTPNGKRKVGDIRAGDYLFGQDGKPTKVLAIHPQPEEKEIWKVTFKSGRTAECCDEHLWGFYSGHKLHTKSLKEIYKESQLKGFKHFDEYRYKIPIAEPVELPVKNYDIDPYTFGLLLSDDDFKYKDKDINEFLKDYSELWNYNSYTKFIPQDYLYGSIEQRLELLRGLMDIDGSFNSSNGRVSYTTMSEQFKDNFMALLASLGMLFYLCEEHNLDEQVVYRIDILIDDNKKEQLFHSGKKKQIVREFFKTHSISQKRDKKTDPIIKIEPLNKKTKMTCFTVDNKDHLFIAGSTWWVTHNTRSMIADACYIGCDRIYDENFGWIGTGVAQPTLFITTEQEKEEVQTMMLAFLSCVNEEHILNGKYEEGEEERIREAATILSQSPLYIEEMPDFSL